MTVHEQMRVADIVVCRAGATTLAEVAAAGLPAVDRAVADRRQRSPAPQRGGFRGRGRRGGDRGESISDRRLVSRLIALAGDRGRRAAMSAAAARMAKPDAADKVLRRAEQLMERAGIAAAGRGAG